ncbi:hypothetical protein [Kurthia zopfii]|uniref:hypothetical protein n=1 Tax=Kurthia zopfii TaxID=1650 RepID=UPI000F828A66|nr:hypothetical protein [Kurthia zopfii]
MNQLIKKTVYKEPGTTITTMRLFGITIIQLLKTYGKRDMKKVITKVKYDLSHKPFIIQHT